MPASRLTGLHLDAGPVVRAYMADLLPFVETLEHRWMRAWMSRDPRVLKSLTSRKFRMVVGSKPCVILDYASWLSAAGSRYTCSSYRFGEIYARDLGSVAIFATQMELEAKLDGEDWSGKFWVTDIWTKKRFRKNWRLIERVLSRPEEGPQVSAAIRSLQLWR